MATIRSKHLITPAAFCVVGAVMACALCAIYAGTGNANADGWRVAATFAVFGLAVVVNLLILCRDLTRGRKRDNKQGEKVVRNA